MRLLGRLNAIEKEVYLANRIFVAFLLLGVCFAQALAQARQDLVVPDKEGPQPFREKMPAWKHRRVEPFMNTPNDLIEVWTARDKGVKIRIVSYKSAQEAREVIRGFLKYEKDKEELNGLGDEADSWGVRRANVVLARGRFIVYIEAGADIDADPQARRLSALERFD